ncbi:aspartic peptidase domain-containing protein [Globomyces pollinis-pini]|nr:aspartic peptidase domain-containing protein [Globomyces pollinis-pini]
MNWYQQILACSFIGQVFSQVTVPLHGHSIASHLQKRDAIHELLYNLQDVFLVGEVKVDNKTLRMVFDTGSADFWVKQDPCTLNPVKTRFDEILNKTIPITHDFSCEPFQFRGINTSDTKTMKKFLNDAVTLNYHSASATVNLYTAEVQFGEFKLPDLIIGVGYDLLKLEFVDGIVGLGLPELSPIAKKLVNSSFTSEDVLKTNFIDYIITNKIAGASYPQFGVYISNSEDYDGSEITIGGTNPAKYKGTPKTFSVDRSKGIWGTDPDGWTIEVDGVSFPRPLVNNSTVISVDTGSSAIYLHHKTATIINAQLGATFNTTDGRDYFPNCNLTGKPALVLKAKGHTFYIPAENLYIPDVNDSSRCLSAVGRVLDKHPVVLGIAFLRSYYSVYTLGRNPSITFFQSIHDYEYGLKLVQKHIKNLSLQLEIRADYEALFGMVPFGKLSTDDIKLQLLKYRQREQEYFLKIFPVKNSFSFDPNQF